MPNTTDRISIFDDVVAIRVGGKVASSLDTGEAYAAFAEGMTSNMLLLDATTSIGVPTSTSPRSYRPLSDEDFRALLVNLSASFSESPLVQETMGG